MITRNKIFREKAPKRQKTQLEKEQAKAKRQRHESKFAFMWICADGHHLEREVTFCERGWKFDFAHVPTKVAIEIEGGIWSTKKKSRHTTGQGYRDDCVKYNRAAALGWTVFRLTPDMITLKQVDEIKKHITKKLRGEP